MSNALTTTSGGGFLALSADAYADLEAAAADLGGGAAGGVFLKFNGNDGIFTYGSTGDELPIGSQVAFDPTSLLRGWICWKDEEVVDEVMVPFTSKTPDKGSLTDHGPYEDKNDGWQEQTIVNFKMVEEPFHDLVFKATGIGKRNAVARLMQDFIRSYKANPGLIPIVEVDEVEYESKAKGARGARKHAPVFKIVAWVSEEELMAGQEGAEGDYDDEPQVEAQAEPADVQDEAPAEEEAAPPARAVAQRPARAPRAAPAQEAAPAAAAAKPAARRGRF